MQKHMHSIFDQGCYTLNGINFRMSFAPAFRSGNADIQFYEGLSPIIQRAEIYHVFYKSVALLFK